jgi:hypothetical protein
VFENRVLRVFGPMREKEGRKEGREGGREGEIV